MNGVNKVVIIGTLGQDPETRYMPDGGAVTNMSVATSENWKDKNSGERKEKTEWHRVVFFGKTAENAGKYLKKGSKVYVEGSLQTRQWEKEGQKHYSTEIKGRDLQFLDSKPAESGQGSPQPSQQEPGYEEFNDDIPF